MARRVARSGVHLGIEEVPNHWSDAQAALDLHFSFMNPDPPLRIIGLDATELREERDRAKAEADRQSSMTLFAAVEAALRVDFQLRVDRRLKDDLSRRFRDIAKSRPRSIRLDDDIIDVWKEQEPPAKADLERLKGALPYRHWLAHGRWFKARLGQAYDFADLRALASRLLACLPLEQAD